MKFFTRVGGVIETVVLPDHRVRLLFLVLALKLKGWDVPPTEVNKLTEIVFSGKAKAMNRVVSEGAEDRLKLSVHAFF